LEIGKRTERGILTLKLVRNMLMQKSSDEMQILTALLEVGDSTLTYFRRYGVKLNIAAIVDLFLCDETNPHSAAYQAVKLQDAINKLPQSLPDMYFTPIEKETVKLLSQLRLADVYALVRDDDGIREKLIEYCDERIREFNNIEELLNREYLDHLPKKGHRAAMATEV